MTEEAICNYYDISDDFNKFFANNTILDRKNLFQV